MKKLSSFCAVILALIIALSCVFIPVSAANASLVTKPAKLTFYQGIDWMYTKDGTLAMLKGGLDLHGTVISYNGAEYSYTVKASGPNMYAKSASGKWVVGKNTMNIYCDDIPSSVYVSTDVTFVAVKSFSIERAPKTKLVLDADWKMGPLNDVEITQYDLTGTVLKVTYTDSAVKTVEYPNASIGWSVPSGTDVIMPGENTFYITFCGQSTPFKVNFITQKNFSKGDVSLDGKITSYDALNILQYSIGSITLSSTQLGLADVSNDSKVNSADALTILQYIVGIKKSL